MTPFRHYPKNITIGTTSFKYTKLCAGFGSEGTTWIYANAPALVDAAVNGVFKPSARWEYWSQPREKRLASEKDKPLYDGSCPMVS